MTEFKNNLLHRDCSLQKNSVLVQCRPHLSWLGANPISQLFLYKKNYVLETFS